MSRTKTAKRRAPKARLLILLMGEDIDQGMLRDIADTRARIHATDKSSRPMSDNYELVGLLGQREFSIRSGLPMDVSIRHEGDGGLNFRTRTGTTIHVSTARSPVHLLCEADKPAADIHVLAKVNDTLTGATLLGWEYDRIMRMCPKRKMISTGPWNHVMLARDLRPVDDLLALIREQEQSSVALP